MSAAPPPLFSCNRLGKVLTVKDGRQQFVLTGKLDDDYFINEIIGVSGEIEETLFHYAIINGYEVAVAIDSAIRLRFATPEMEMRYNQIVNRETKDDSGVPWTDDTEATQKNSRVNRSDTEQAVSQVTASSATKAKEVFDLIHTRLIPCKCKSFIIFKNPEQLVVFGEDGNLTPESRQQLETLRCWAFPKYRGNNETCTILLVDDSCVNQFREISDRIKGGLEDRTKEVCIGPPDLQEVEALLTRVQCRYGLKGYADRIAKIVHHRYCAKGGRSNGLYNITQAIREEMAKEPRPTSLDELFLESSDREKILAEAHKELDSMIGLATVRKRIEELSALARKRAMDRELGKDNTAHSMHMIFLGNPGTGKTVIARILGKIFYGLGLCTSQNFVEIDSAEITSTYNSGEVVQNMQEKIREATGGVLFIDEVYTFAESEWLRQAFNALMKEMEDHRDSIIVIIAGYRDRLNDVYQINPGIEDRFPNKIDFPDYSLDELMRMLEKSLSKENHVLTPKAIEKTRRFIADKKRIGKFANGRGVRNLFEKITLKATLKHQGGELDEGVIPEIERQETVDEILAELDRKFIGLQRVKEQIRRFAKRIEHDERKGLSSSDRRYNMQFVGNPGTGKTTIARYMSRVFNALGLIEGTDIIERGATSLKASYLGQSKDNVLALFKRAREEGKVLFIDEAYSLFPRHTRPDEYGIEVIDTFVAEMTAANNAGVVTVFAGYPEDMQHMMDHANPGLKSRVPVAIDFPDYTTDECIEIFQLYVTGKNYQLEESQRNEIIDRIKTIIDVKKQDPHFANARVVGTLVETIIDNHIMRDDESDTIKLEDIPFV